jgi:hypothetical protein
MTGARRATSQLFLVAAVFVSFASLRDAPGLVAELGQPSHAAGPALSQAPDAQSLAFLRAGAVFRVAIGGQRSRDSRSAGQSPATAAGSGLTLAFLVSGSILLLSPNARSASRRTSRSPRAPPHLLPA